MLFDVLHKILYKFLFFSISIIFSKLTAIIFTLFFLLKLFSSKLNIIFCISSLSEEKTDKESLLNLETFSIFISSLKSIANKLKSIRFFTIKSK